MLQAASTFWSGWWWELAIAVAVFVVTLVVYKIVLPGLIQRGSLSVIEFIEAEHKKK